LGRHGQAALAEGRFFTEETMLVLSRKKSKTVFIFYPGCTVPIQVTVVDIRGDKVRLGFTAPPEVIILRDDVGRNIKDTCGNSGK